MAKLTQAQRIRGLEIRLETLERLFMEYRRQNAQQSVGGDKWVREDQRAIDEARHRDG